LLRVKAYPTPFEGSPAVSILNVLLRNGVAVSHLCGGKAVCGTCRIRILEGVKNLSPMGEAERVRLLHGRQDGTLPENVRLACQTYARGDVTIQVLAAGK
jgi:adenylate cyclase